MTAGLFKRTAEWKARASERLKEQYKDPAFLAARQAATRQGVRQQEATSSFVGVHLHYKKWDAGIKKDGKRYHLGRFNTQEEAARAYDAKARELYGDKARLNFPDEANR